jgi:hypothetical protein
MSMDATNPPTRPPTAQELLADPTVQQALEQAWIDSRPDDPIQRHEEGGWIYMDTRTGKVIVKRVSAGQQAELEIGDPPLVADSVVVATFHTHPNPTAEGWNPGPSDADRAIHAQLGLPGLIRADDGVHTMGPACRLGGLT